MSNVTKRISTAMVAVFTAFTVLSSAAPAFGAARKVTAVKKPVVAAATVNYNAAVAAINAVSAAFRYDMNNLSNISYAKAKVVLARTAVAKVTPASKRTYLVSILNVQAAKVTSAENRYYATQSVRITAATAAVNAYVASPLTTPQELAAAKVLKALAESKVALVANKAAFTAQMNAMNKKLQDAETALAPEKVTTASAISGTLTITFDKAPKAAPTAADLALSSTINGGTAATVTAGNITWDNSKTVTVTVPVIPATTADQSVVYNVSYKGAAPVASAAYTVAANFGITSVTSLNLKQIKVVFNKTVDKTAAENLANYKLAQGTNAAVALTGNDMAVLQSDGKSVVITLESTANLANQQNYSLTVSNAKDTTGTILADTTNTFSVLDLAIPQALSVQVVSPTTLKVMYSAPIQASASTDYVIDNGQYSVTTGAITSANHAEYSVILNLGAQLSAGNHTLVVAPANGTAPTAFNNLKPAATTLNFTVVNNTTAPTVTAATIKLLSASTSQVQFKFSAPVALNNADFYYNYDQVGTAIQAPTVIPTSATASVGNPVVIDPAGTTFNLNGIVYADTYNVYFAAAFPTGQTAFYVDNDASVTTNSTKYIQDAWNNKFVSARVMGTLAIDSSKPSVSSVVMNGQNKIDITFNKILSNGLSTTKYTLKDITGAVVTPSTITGINLDYNGHPISITDLTATKGYYEISLGTALKPGNYILNITGIQDTVIPVANTMDTKDFSLAVTDTTAPVVSKVTKDSTNKKLYVYFSKAMNTSGAGSITDASNYLLAGSALPTGTTIIAANGNTQAIISFASAQTFTTLSIGTVKDTLGNMIANLGAANQVIGSDGIAATDIVAGSIKAIDVDTLTFEVAQPLSAINANHITVNGVVASTASYINQAVNNGTQNGALVTVKVPALNVWAADVNNIAANAIVFTNADALTNINLGQLTDALAGYNVVKASVKDYIAPAFSTVTAPATSGVNGNIAKVRITFNEAIQVSTVTTSTFGVAGYNVLDVQAVTPSAGTDGSMGATAFDVLLTKKVTMDSDATPAVTLLQAVKDNSAQHNVLSSGTPLTTVDKAGAGAPIVTLADTDSNAAISAGDKITLTFNEAVKLAAGAVADTTTSSAVTDAAAVNADTNGYSTTWVITVAAGDVTNGMALGDALKVDKTKVTDASAAHNNSEADLTVTMPSNF